MESSVLDMQNHPEKAKKVPLLDKRDVSFEGQTYGHTACIRTEGIYKAASV